MAFDLEITKENPCPGDLFSSLLAMAVCMQLSPKGVTCRDDECRAKMLELSFIEQVVGKRYRVAVAGEKFLVKWMHKSPEERKGTKLKTDYDRELTLGDELE